MCLQLINTCANGSNCIFPERDGKGQHTAIRYPGGRLPCMTVAFGSHNDCREVKKMNCAPDARMECMDCWDKGKGKDPTQEAKETRYQYYNPEFTNAQEKICDDIKKFSTAYKQHVKQEEQKKAEEAAARDHIDPTSTPVMTVLTSHGTFKTYPLSVSAARS